jgi:tetratricopeptide (TPR) repeat protein
MGTPQGTWDSLLDSELSPYRLLFARRNMPGLGIEKALDLQARLGQALATLTPDEQPGFEPVQGLDPLAAAIVEDPLPRAWLTAIIEGQLDQIEEQQVRLQSLMTRGGGWGWEVQESNLERLKNLGRQRQAVLTQQALLNSDPDALRRELRLPATQALWLARDLREEGQAARARILALRARDDLDRAGISNAWYFVGVERLVRTDLVIGSCYTDEDEPLLAEETLLGAVERLDGVLSRLESRGVSSGAMAPFQALQSNALVSLAVNANVRLGQPARALEYYERAYALRQDEFMHVLLACYRARSGKSMEARRVLRRVRPGPRTWYNMACTYALLGESTSALDMLEQELKDNHSSVASRNRQRAWAAQDPDLASLREDPRFQALTRKTDR